MASKWEFNWDSNVLENKPLKILHPELINTELSMTYNMYCMYYFAGVESAPMPSGISSKP
jgi:hypothetical protein